MARLSIPEADALLDKPFPVLDHGFVRLVDYLGGDARIVQAARVSYGEGTKTVREDRALIDYLLRNRHCYDAATEVLTDKGFLTWADAFERAAQGEPLAVGLWDSYQGSLVYEPPAYWTRDAYDGPMYSVEHGGVELLVTPDHKMYVSGRKWDNAQGVSLRAEYDLVPAEALGHRSMARYKKVAPYCVGLPWDGAGFPQADDRRALLELIGFFVGDGHASPIGRAYRNAVVFHLKKPREIEFLRSRTASLGWRLEERPSYDGRRKFVLWGPDLNTIFRRQFYTDEGQKRLPEWCLKLNAEDARSLLNGLRNSDGSEKRGTWCYATSHGLLAEQLQRVCLHAGEAAHYAQNAAGMWNVNILSQMREPVVNQGQQDTAWQEYRGDVYCAHTRTGVMVVRRGGKIVLSGNTSPFEQVIFTFHLKMPIFVARQWLRHRTARLNEVSGRYSVMRDEFYAPRAHEVRYQSVKNKQGGDDKDVPEALREEVIRALHDEQRDTYRNYEGLLERGVARELARINLPLSLYTEMYWQIDLNNLFHFLRLRMDWHAQYEIRAYGDAMAGIVRAVAPMAFEAFEEHILHGRTLSRSELELLRAALDLDKLAGLLEASTLRKTRRQELLDKLGVALPAVAEVESQ
jgi:thymidylate synthase (FAD)